VNDYTGAWTNEEGRRVRGFWPKVYDGKGGTVPLFLAVPWKNVDFIDVDRLGPRMRLLARNFMDDAADRGEGWDQFDGAYNTCDEASPAFQFFLENAGVRSRLRQYVLSEGKGTNRPLNGLYTVRSPIPHFVEPDYNFHVVNVVGRLVFDWTARQFDETLPYPAIWRDERP
jgi:hypothetical protein